MHIVLRQKSDCRRTVRKEASSASEDGSRCVSPRDPRTERLRRRAYNQPDPRPCEGKIKLLLVDVYFRDVNESDLKNAVLTQVLINIVGIATTVSANFRKTVLKKK